MAVISGRTGERVQIPGIYASNQCHSVERTMPKDHIFPPCPHCHSAVVWTLVRATQTK